jgi:hypothetical protein
VRTIKHVQSADDAAVLLEDTRLLLEAIRGALGSPAGGGPTTLREAVAELLHLVALTDALELQRLLVDARDELRRKADAIDALLNAKGW